MKIIGTLILLTLFSTSALAECNVKKAARNKMLDNKVGVSGNCDTEKAIKVQATNKIDDTFNIDSKKVKEDSIEKKENIEKNISTTKKVINTIK